MKNKTQSLSLAIFFLFTAVPIAISFGYATLYSFGLIGILRGGFTFSYWINTSAPQEVAAFEALIRTGRSPLEAVCELAKVDPAEILPSANSKDTV